MVVVSPRQWELIEARMKRDGISDLEAYTVLAVESLVRAGRERRERQERVREEIIQITQKYATTTFACNAVVDELTELVMRGDTHNASNTSEIASGGTASSE